MITSVVKRPNIVPVLGLCLPEFLVTSNFSFSHSVFYFYGELSIIFIKVKFVVWEMVNQNTSIFLALLAESQQSSCHGVDSVVRPSFSFLCDKDYICGRIFMKLSLSISSLA